MQRARRHTRSALFAAALTSLVALVLAPLALLVLSRGPGGPSPAIEGAVLSFLTAWALTLWDRRLPWWVPLLYPLLFGHLLWMAWRCFGRVVTGRGVVWKGRVVR